MTSARIINHHGNVEEVSCETCGGEGTVNEFRRFAGEYMAGEFVGVTCPDCDGSGTEELAAPRKPYVPSPEYLAWCAEVDSKRTTVVHSDPLLKDRRAA